MRTINVQVFSFITAVFALMSFTPATACDAPSSSFCVDYFKSRDLTGPVVLSANESNIDHNWVSGSPGPSVPIDNFSARWRGKFNFDGGNVIFRVFADDGARVRVDGQIVLDGWKYQTTEYLATVPVTTGEHLVEVEYYEAWGAARVAASWEPVRTCDVPVGQFCAAFYDNRNLTGNPKFITHEPSINHLWGNGAPAPTLPADSFSGRWQGEFDFAPGTYSFTANTDDGARLYVDGHLLIDDAWVTQGATLYEDKYWLSGRHLVTVEYYEAYGSAVLQVGWNLIAPATGHPADIGANASSPLGTNLSDWKDWSTEQPFIDIFKTSRNWIPQAPGVWDTGEQPALDLDPNGWVRSLPAANDTSVRYRTVSTLLLSGQDFVGVRPGGEYVVLYDGEGSLTYGYAATKLTSYSSPGRDVINVNKTNANGILITIASTDPNHTGNYLRNIRVAPPGVVCDDDLVDYCLAENDPDCNRSACRTMEAAVTDRLFHPLFLRNLVHYRSLRFMNPQSTNVIASGQPQQVDWSNRATPDKARWNGQAGIPVEVAVALSNQIHADPWLNMPHQASDDYMRQFARLVRASLNPSRKVYVEYANEIWNTAFSAGSWVEQQAVAAWPNTPDHPYVKRINWYGKRTAEMCDIWKAEWAGEESRVVCVLAAQAANTSTATVAFDCRLWNQAPCIAHGIQALAIAPYFGHYVGNVATGSEVASWTLDSDGGLGRLFGELGVGGQLTGGPQGGALAWAAQWVAQYANLAKARGLTLLAYEGGQHLVGIGTVQNDPNITHLFVNANRDTRMGDLYLRLLGNWRDAGGGLFMNYSSMGQYGRYGSWGAMEYMGQGITPKTDALYQFIQANPTK